MLPSDRREAVAGAVIGLIGLLAFAVIMMRLPEMRVRLASADALYFPDLGDDLLYRLREIGGWRLAPAARFFPDLAIFVPIEFLVRDFRSAILLAGAVQIVLFAHAGYLIWRRLGPISPLSFQAVLLAIFGTVLGAGWLLARDVVTAWYEWAFLEGTHFGALLGMLWSVALALPSAADPAASRPLRLAGFVTLCGLSDLFYVAQFALPYLVTVWALALAEGRRPRLGREAVAVAGGAVAGLVLGVALAPSSSVYLFNWVRGPVHADARQLVALWRPGLAERLVSLIILGLAAAVVVQAVERWRALNRRPAAPLAPTIRAESFVLLLFSVSIVTAILVPVLCNLAFDDSTLRYALPAAFLPPVWLAGRAARSIDAWTRRRGGGRWLLYGGMLLPAIFLSLGAIVVLPPGAGAVAAWTPAPPALDCFAKDEHAAGLALYWRARPLTLYSDRRLQIAQIQRQGLACSWMTNRAWAKRDRTNPEAPVHFGFILMDGLDPKAITERYGAPERVEICGKTEIWRYDPADLTRRFLAERPARSC